MDLIEQLGGYERAKDGLHRLKLEKKDLLTCGDLVVVESEIDAALLQYRRQHNIFEVGDKVVVKDHPFWPEDYVILTVEQEHIGKWYMSAWRHATDEEIKAGKRLEVNQ